MFAARQNERPKLRFRTDRIFHSENDWFFHTREGVDVGPYSSKFDAEVEAALLQAVLSKTLPGTESLRIIREFVEDGRSLRMTKATVGLDDGSGT